MGMNELTHSYLQQPKPPDYFDDISLSKAIFRKIFEGELFIQTPSTTLLQIFYKFMLHSKVIFKSMIGPDNNDQGINGLKKRKSELHG